MFLLMASLNTKSNAKQAFSIQLAMPCAFVFLQLSGGWWPTIACLSRSQFPPNVDLNDLIWSSVIWMIWMIRFDKTKSNQLQIRHRRVIIHNHPPFKAALQKAWPIVHISLITSPTKIYVLYDDTYLSAIYVSPAGADDSKDVGDNNAAESKWTNNCQFWLICADRTRLFALTSDQCNPPLPIEMQTHIQIQIQPHDFRFKSMIVPCITLIMNTSKHLWQISKAVAFDLCPRL